jgi:hypothetical protein
MRTRTVFSAARYGFLFSRDSVPFSSQPCVLGSCVLAMSKVRVRLLQMRGRWRAGAAAALAAAGTIAGAAAPAAAGTAAAAAAARGCAAIATGAGGVATAGLAPSAGATAGARASPWLMPLGCAAPTAGSRRGAASAAGPCAVWGLDPESSSSASPAAACLLTASSGGTCCRVRLARWCGRRAGRPAAAPPVGPRARRDASGRFRGSASCVARLYACWAARLAAARRTWSEQQEEEKCRHASARGAAACNAPSSTAGRDPPHCKIFYGLYSTICARSRVW